MSAREAREPRSGASLAARGVVFEYAETPGSPRALDGVDVDLAGGELVVVIGPNGSGKSTLLALLAGHRAPAAGSVTLGGVPLSSLRPRERARRIAVVPQYLPALPEVLVSTFVESGRYAHVARSFGARGLSRADRESAERALAACDAEDLASRAMTELSGGQRQRVLVARAIAQEAPMLLIDEPTNALDPEHQIAVFELLARLCAEGRGTLVVTHDLNLASQYATRLVLLERGRVAARGGPADVLRREVLEPVYGPDLWYGTWPGEPGEPAETGRPYVLARRPG